MKMHKSNAQAKIKQFNSPFQQFR